MAKLENVLLQGLASARPAAADVANGTLYYSTDTGLLEQSNGTAWSDYATNPADLVRRGTLAAQPAASAVPAGTLYCITDLGNLVQRSTGSAWEDFSLGSIRGLVTVTDFAASYTTVKSQALTTAVGDQIKFRLTGSIFNGTGGARTWSIRMSFAGETLVFDASATVADTTTTLVYIDGFIDIHSTTVSRFAMKGRLNPDNPDDTMTTDIERSVWSFVSAVDFTGAQTLLLEVKSATAGAGAVYRASFLIEHLKA